MSGNVIYSDLDSTVWDLHDPLGMEGAKKIFGEAYTYDDLTDWDCLKNKYGKDFFQIYEYALDPSRIGRRELYPNFVYIVTYLYALGYDWHFISHNPKPKLIYNAVADWLLDKLETPFELTIFGARNDKVDYILDNEDAYCLIEDKPSTLKKSYDSGILTIARLHNWNRKVVEKRNIARFDNWIEVPQILGSIK